MPIALIRNAQQYKLDVHLVSSQLCSHYACTTVGTQLLTITHKNVAVRHAIVLDIPCSAGWRSAAWVNYTTPTIPILRIVKVQQDSFLRSGMIHSRISLAFAWRSMTAIVGIDHSSSGANSQSSHTLIQSCPKLPMIRTEAH